MGVALLWMGLIVATAGWVMIFAFVNVSVPGFRDVEEVVNVHRLGIAIAVIFSGFSVAIMGAIAMVFEKVSDRRFVGSASDGKQKHPSPRLGIGFVAKESGGVVSSVSDGSAAQSADLRVRDVIVAVDGTSLVGLSEAEMLSLLTADASPLELLVMRQDREVLISIHRY